MMRLFKVSTQPRFCRHTFTRRYSHQQKCGNAHAILYAVRKLRVRNPRIECNRYKLLSLPLLLI